MSFSLLLLPGMDGTGLLFEPLIKALPKAISPIVVRYPGDRQLSYAELLPIVLTAIPPSEPFIVLGESFSGPLAVMIAATKPANLIGLVLCASFVTPPWPFIRPAILIFARTLPFRLYLPYKRLKSRSGGYSTLQHRALLSEMCRLIRPNVIAARVRMVFRIDVRKLLDSCGVPILYLQGAHDLVVPGRNLRTIQQIKPGIQVVRIASSHMVLQRQPTLAARAIADFASSLDALTRIEPR